MSEEQMRARGPGASKKALDRSFPGKFVGIDLKSSAYKILDIEKNVVIKHGAPFFVRQYTEFGQVMASFPDPAESEPVVPACDAGPRPEPYHDCYVGRQYTICSISAYYDGADDETYAIVQLRDSDGDIFWTSAVQYLMVDPYSDAYFALTQWIARRRALDCVNQYYPLWTVVKAQERKGAPLCPAILISSDMRRKRSYGVVFQPSVLPGDPRPAVFHEDLRAGLVVFPDTHSACHLPFADTPEQDQ